MVEQIGVVLGVAFQGCCLEGSDESRPEWQVEEVVDLLRAFAGHLDCGDR